VREYFPVIEFSIGEYQTTRRCLLHIDGRQSNINYDNCEVNYCWILSIVINDNESLLQSRALNGQHLGEFHSLL
jgi:hypothetical protein